MTRPAAYPQKPEGIEAPGLQWRRRATRWAAIWVCRGDIAKRGYSVKSIQLWPTSTTGAAATELTADEWLAIASVCRKNQEEMLAWANGGIFENNPTALFDDTFASLIEIYKRDADSPYHALRFHTKKQYDSLLNTLTNAVGKARISALSFRDFKRWHEGFEKPLVEGGTSRTTRAHGLMTMVRIVFAFAALVELPRCVALKGVLEGMTFPNPKKRVDFISAEQAAAIRTKAHEMGYPSIALAQAFQFELMLRQKDVIGEWLPMQEPGLSEITSRGEKWLHGIHWNEIDQNMVLTHRLSKSLRGRNAVMKPGEGKVERYDLTAYPMVIEELARIPVAQREGALVVAEHTGIPWRQKMFAEKWRLVATAAGVPKTTQNRDSRAGAITEGRKSGASLEDLRHGAGHSLIQTTARYDRTDIETKNKIAKLRVHARNEKKTS